MLSLQVLHATWFNLNNVSPSESLNHLYPNDMHGPAASAIHFGIL